MLQLGRTVRVVRTYPHPVLRRRLRPWSHRQEPGSRILGPSLQGAHCGAVSVCVGVVSVCVGVRVRLHWRAFRVRVRGVVDLTTYYILRIIPFSL